MQSFRLTFIAAIFLFVASCATAPLPPREESPMLVEITRDGEDWLARFTLPQDRMIWAFHRTGLDTGSNQPWRQSSWNILTPGITLERVGDFDALIGEQGAVPRVVDISFTPTAVDLTGEYDPAIILSNGSLALFTGHFTAFPMDDLEELRGMDHGWDFPARVNLHDTDGPVLHLGQFADSFTLAEEGYVVFGPVNLVPAAHVDSIHDPGLPQWLSVELASYTGLAFDHYTARLGAHSAPRPTLFAAWQGPTPGITRVSGSVSGDMVTLVFGGEGFERRNYPALVRAQQFIAHEAAHFWLGQTIGYETREDSWITEGGATFLAIRLQETLDGVNEREAASFRIMRGLSVAIIGEETPDLVDPLEEALLECPKWLAKGDLRGAVRRQEHEAAYDCGGLFALAVEHAGARHDEDYFDFVRLLIAANPDGIVTMDEWLDEAVRFGLAEEKRQLIRRLLLEGSQNGEADLARLLAPDP